MASNSCSRTGEQAINRQEEIARDLEREIEKNRRSRTEGANAAGSSSTSPSKKLPTPLLMLLVECWGSLTPQRNKGFFPPSGGSRGLSPSQSVSSDSSVCGGFIFRDVEGINPTTMGLPKTALARLNYDRGGNNIAAKGIKETVVGQEGAGPTPNPRIESSAPNGRRGMSGALVSECAPKAIECSHVKVPKKRKRKSKKVPPTIIQVPLEEFCATVRKLTGFKEHPAPAVLLQPESHPQPERPQANAVPIDVDLGSCNPPPRPDSSLTRMMSAARSPSTIVSDRAPEATFSIHTSATSGYSSSKSSGLNYCMGYEQAIPFFLEEQQQDYDENLGQLQDDSHCPAPDSMYRLTSEPMESKKQEVSTTRAISAVENVQDAATHRAESRRKEDFPGDFPREHWCSGSNHDLVSGARNPHPFAKPSPVLVPSHRPGEPNGFEMEFESDDLDWWMFNGEYGEYMHMADSFLNCQ